MACWKDWCYDKANVPGMQRLHRECNTVSQLMDYVTVSDTHRSGTGNYMWPVAVCIICQLHWSLVKMSSLVEFSFCCGLFSLLMQIKYWNVVNPFLKLPPLGPVINNLEIVKPKDFRSYFICSCLQTLLKYRNKYSSQSLEQIQNCICSDDLGEIFMKQSVNKCR